MAIACGIAAAGFASLATFGIPAVRDFGLMAAFGILSTLVLELTFIPACPRAAARAAPRRKRARERSTASSTPRIDVLAARGARAPRRCCSRPLLAAHGGAVGIARIDVNSAFRSWFDADAPVIAADNAIRARFTGTSTIRVLVEGDAPDALLDPAVLRGMAALQRALRDERRSRARSSLADYVQVMNRALHDGGPDALARARDARGRRADDLLLFEPDDLVARRERRPRDRRHPRALAPRSRRWVEALFARLREVAAREFPPSVRVEIGGGELGAGGRQQLDRGAHKLENMGQIAAS